MAVRFVEGIKNEVITSTANAQVKQLMQLRKKAKERNVQDVFLVEGPKMYLEVPRERLVQTYISEAYYQKNRALFDGGSPVTVLSNRVFENVSDTRTPQGVLCLVRQYHYELEDLLGQNRQAEERIAGKPLKAGEKQRTPGGQGTLWEQASTERREPCRAQSPGILEKRGKPLLVVLENLQDPGNLGTIVRTAEGAGVTGILLGPGCVDIYNSKVIRSTMGAIYRMPFYYTDDLFRDLTWLRENGVRLFAAHLEGSILYDEADYAEASAFLIGNESQGLTEKTAMAADERIRIPMYGEVESLNAAVAASVLMYEANRQRRLLL